MSPRMKITTYRSPQGELQDDAAAYRLLEIAIRGFDQAAAVPGSSTFWPVATALQDLGQNGEAVVDQAGMLLQTYRLSSDAMLNSALYLVPGGATLYVNGTPDAVLPRCTRAVGGTLPTAAVTTEFAPNNQVIALAIREFTALPAELDRATLEQQLTLVGFITFVLAV